MYACVWRVAPMCCICHVCMGARMYAFIHACMHVDIAIAVGKHMLLGTLWSLAACKPCWEACSEYDMDINIARYRHTEIHAILHRWLHTLLYTTQCNTTQYTFYDIQYTIQNNYDYNTLQYIHTNTHTYINTYCTTYIPSGASREIEPQVWYIHTILHTYSTTYIHTVLHTYLALDY